MDNSGNCGKKKAIYNWEAVLVTLTHTTTTQVGKHNSLSIVHCTVNSTIYNGPYSK